jgi:hypothetical protein
MTDIYAKHEAAFKQVSASALFCPKEQRQIGHISFKFPKDGAGRLTCYIHIFGQPMVCGTANGYGYDKRTAADLPAASKLKTDDSYPAYSTTQAAIVKQALDTDGGYSWDRYLMDAGLMVLQAV